MPKLMKLYTEKQINELLYLQRIECNVAKSQGIAILNAIIPDLPQPKYLIENELLVKVCEKECNCSDKK